MQQQLSTERVVVDTLSVHNHTQLSDVNSQLPSSSNIWGVFPMLRQWVADDKPVWGTCAGMILLSNTALVQKEGGQALVGGLDVEICRNYFGAQISSFEQPIDTTALDETLESETSVAGSNSTSTPYPAIFIRAPAILSSYCHAGHMAPVAYCVARTTGCITAINALYDRTVSGEDVTVLAKVRAAPCDKARRLLRESCESPTNTKANDTSSSSGSKAATTKVTVSDAYHYGTITVSESDRCRRGDSTAERASKRQRLAQFLVEPSSSSSSKATAAEVAAGSDAAELPEVIVAAKKRNILVTAFHPELTSDTRWHAYFMRMVAAAKAAAAAAPKAAST
eukprot:7635-Heterococcus_DN1.PRE.1